MSNGEFDRNLTEANVVLIDNHRKNELDEVESITSGFVLTETQILEVSTRYSFLIYFI